MNIVVINDEGVEVFKTFREVQKYTSFEKSEFAKIGNDYVLNVTGESYEISKDIKLLERVAAQKVFGKKPLDTTALFSLITMILALLVYMKL